MHSPVMTIKDDHRAIGKRGNIIALAAAGMLGALAVPARPDGTSHIGLQS
jgi:hypothetical protein